MIRVCAHARLHFALLDMSGSHGRIDGGIGCAIENPKVVVEAERAHENELIDIPAGAREGVARAVDFFRGIYRVRVVKAIPEHAGLGSITQTVLAAARALAELEGRAMTVPELALVCGRGGTSGVGTAAFERGGLVVDGGHTFGKGKQKERLEPSSVSRAPPPPILARYELPLNWHFACFIPHQKKIFGEKEARLFARSKASGSEAAKVAHLVLMKMLPAVVERDIGNFGTGLTELQKYGTVKWKVQPKESHALLARLQMESYGAGLSSFGPLVYALAEGRKHAGELVEKFGTESSFIARVENSGAVVETGGMAEEDDIVT